jgi:uncharacterized membrane protein YhaH (DUF805 family)
MQARSFKLFWYYWLVVAVFGVIGFGLALIFLPNLMQDFFNWFLATFANKNTAFGGEAKDYIVFVYGIVGGVMIGWGVSLLALLFGSFRQGERSGWNALALSVLGWYIFDSGFSIVSGFAGNLIFNTAFLVLFAVPLVATYKSFYGSLTPAKNF